MTLQFTYLCKLHNKMLASDYYYLQRDLKNYLSSTFTKLFILYLIRWQLSSNKVIEHFINNGKCCAIHHYHIS